MSKKHKKDKKIKKTKAAVKQFELVNGKPMHSATQWFLIGAVAATAAIKIIEASVELSLQAIIQAPGIETSNLWISLLV